MPVMLDQPAAKAWLKDGPITAEELATFARPFPPERMDGWPVSTYVNSSRNQGPQCCEPVVRGKLTAEKNNGEQLNLF